jgi:uncharacterized DUF497 family protein
MKRHDWSEEKNQLLHKERSITFEDVLFQIESGSLIGIISHPNQEDYSHQKVYIVNIDDYIYLVPFVEDDEKVFMKTIIPSRKATKKYLKERGSK